jgi:low temperature requirement protein LtrA
MTERAPTTLAHRLHRMTGRNPDEAHRAASPLELLFDLAFVVTFGLAGNEMAHLVAEGHDAAGIGGFGFVMFAIVWAWINFAWFSSAFDTDDWLARLSAMVGMVGVVILAVGIPDVFHSLDVGDAVNIRVLVAGYVVMRVAVIGNWARVAVQAPAYRRAAVTYIVAVSIAQVGWTLLAIPHLALGPTLAIATVLYVIELSGPAVAEHRQPTPWHPHHIAERYSLLVIIALGEGVIGTVTSVSPLVHEHGWSFDAIVLIVAGVLLTFGLWWIYFAIPFGDILARNRGAGWVWGYGHIVLFAALAAVGSGLHVGAFVVEGVAHVGYETAVYAVAIPVGVFLVALFAIYAAAVRTLDTFHLLLISLVVVTLVLAGVLAGEVSFGVCVLIVSAAPLIVVLGFELVGHRHALDHLEHLERPVGAPAN